MEKKEEANLFINVLYDIRKKILLSFYILSITSLGILSIVIIGHIPGISPRIQLLFGILFAIAGIVGGAFLSVVIDLPNISFEFDKIKNDIALKKIDSPEVFGQRVVSLLCNYFTFLFLTVKYAFVKIIDTDCVCSDNRILKIINESDLNSIENRSQRTEDDIYLGTYVIEDRKYHLYVFPIWFCNVWLGYVGILTTTKLMKIFRSFLADFEDNYLDDQLIHVLDIKTKLAQRQFYMDINAFSDKITRQEYKTIREYQNDILQFLVRKTGCAGGVFNTVYNEESITYFKDKSFNDTQIKEYYKNWNQGAKDLSRSRITSPSDVPFEYVLEIPIFLNGQKGMIFLFDNNEHKLKRTKDFIIGIVSIRLYYDLKNLAFLLNL